MRILHDGEHVAIRQDLGRNDRAAAECLRPLNGFSNRRHTDEKLDEIVTVGGRWPDTTVNAIGRACIHDPVPERIIAVDLPPQQRRVERRRCLRILRHDLPLHNRA